MNREKMGREKIENGKKSKSFGNMKPIVREKQTDVMFHNCIITSNSLKVLIGYRDYCNNYKNVSKNYN